MRFLFIVCFAMLFSSCTTSDADRVMKKAEKLHRNMFTVDTHCDTPLRLMRSQYDLGGRHENGCVDFPRMSEGGLHGEFFAAFIGQGPRNQEEYNRQYEFAQLIIDSIHANINRNSTMAGLALTPDDALKLFHEGRIAAFIGLENGYPLGLDLSRVEAFYNHGVRYITLCHTKNNDICDSSTDPAGPENNGLSSFGVSVVKEMNRIGMMIDVSHISDKAFYDVLLNSGSPVIASHSSCRALCESPRNLSDDMLLALRQNGGVIQICIYSSYLRQPDPNPEMDAKIAELKEKWSKEGDNLTDDQKEQRWNEYSAIKDKYEELATVEDAVNHIMHVIDVIGVDYVGIGTDFDGGGGIEGCKDASQMKNITAELIRRGISPSDIKKIWGGNVMRVMRKVNEVAGK